VIVMVCAAAADAESDSAAASASVAWRVMAPPFVPTTKGVHRACHRRRPPPAIG
jgi:hypothetical protein